MILHISLGWIAQDFAPDFSHSLLRRCDVRGNVCVNVVEACFAVAFVFQDIEAEVLISCSVLLVVLFEVGGDRPVVGLDLSAEVGKTLMCEDHVFSSKDLVFWLSDEVHVWNYFLAGLTYAVFHTHRTGPIIAMVLGYVESNEFSSLFVEAFLSEPEG